MVMTIAQIGIGADAQAVSAPLFWVLALVTGAASVGVAFSGEIVRTAVWLLLALLGVAGIYLLLDAQFLAAAQLVVYAGGTLVLIVFGVMLTSQSPLARLRVSTAQTWAAAVVGVVLLAAIWAALWAVSDRRLAAPTGPVPQGTAGTLGILLLGDYLIPFELASVILLVVMIGAAYLAKARRSGKPGKMGAG
jgi:NADH:ubiquinone oxidoreductase subunit 6 (subunit J)